MGIQAHPHQAIQEVIIVTSHWFQFKVGKLWPSITVKCPASVDTPTHLSDPLFLLCIVSKVCKAVFPLPSHAAGEARGFLCCFFLIHSAYFGIWPDHM